MPILTNELLTLIELDEEDEREETRKKVEFTLLLMERTIGLRNEKYTRQRLNWSEHAAVLQREGKFQRTYRMSLKSFHLLIALTTPHFKQPSTHGGQVPIIPKIMLLCTLRYLAGGSYLDIRQIAGVSVATFFRLVWTTIKAINLCPALCIELPTAHNTLQQQADHFASISSASNSHDNKIFDGCVGCVDGYLQPFQPSSRDQTNVAAFFNGHYQRHGINCQAMCDHISRFTFFSVMSPGSVNDVIAFDDTDLKDWVNLLPVNFYIAGDNAYRLSERLLTPYYGENKNNKHFDSFNFYLSQLRIRIEMSFGLLAGKWCILSRPLRIKLCNVKDIMMCAVRLHNYCINCRLMARKTDKSLFDNSLDVFERRINGEIVIPNGPPTNNNTTVIDPHNNSSVRDRLTRQLKDSNIYRPA